MEVVPEKEPIDINELIEIVRYGYLRDKIEKLRNTKSDATYKAIKRSDLPAVTLSGTFKKRSNTELINYSGLMQLDIDKVANYSELFRNIADDVYTYLCFKSPGGKGIKVIVKVGNDPANHRKSFLSLSKYYQDKFNIEIDQACKDISRAMLLSWDPELFCNPFSHPYYDLKEEIIVAAPKAVYKKKAAKKKFKSFNDSDVVERIIDEVEKRKLDLTATYLDWFRIGCALSTTFGENGRAYYHRLSQFYPGYKPSETEKAYTSTLNRGKHSVTLGSLVHFARAAGIDI